MTPDSARPICEISLFGGLLVRRVAGDILELTGQKDRALLGFLAVSPGVPFAREKLASLLWGESGDRQARDSLKQALLRLRRALNGVVPDLLISTRHSVKLDTDAATVDVVTFEALLSEGTVDALERASSLYRGDLLDGLQCRGAGFEDWLRAERQRLRAMAVEAAAKTMRQLLATGHRERAAAAAQRLLFLDPLHESACRTMMQVHAERGERAQALKLFERLRDRLASELSVTPEQVTVDLYKSIRQSCSVDAVPAGAQERQEERPPALAAAPSIAVLPFANIGDEPERDFFADGLTEDIITDLSRVSSLFVAARSSVFTFKGRAVQVQEAARELRVRYILEGSVRAAKSRMRITAQLVDGMTGGYLWAERYDRSLDDIFALQAEISASIVEALKLKLLPEELAGFANRPTHNVEAYQAYLMGRSFYLRGMDKQSLRIARDLFFKATEIDPGYARAFAALAICGSYLSMSLSMDDPDEGLEACLAHSLRALELDPGLAEGFAGKGLALYAAGRYVEATPEFERAIELGPDLFEAHFFYARNCRLQGLRRQAAMLFERSAALRPNDYRALGLFAEECQALGRNQAFHDALRRCLERLEAEIEASPENAGALAFGSAVLVDLGQGARAEDWAERAVRIGPDDCLVRYNVARAQALLGNPCSALDHLERAFRCSPIFQRRFAMWMRHDEDIDPLREHPRFRLLLEHLETSLGCLEDVKSTAQGSGISGNLRPD